MVHFESISKPIPMVILPSSPPYPLADFDPAIIDHHETSAASDWRATLQYPPTTTSTGEMNPVEDPKETKGGDLGDVAASHFPNNAIHAGFLAENSRTLCFPRVVNVS